MAKYFGTDGARGRANDTLTLDMAVKIGQYVGWYYGKERHAKILIGKDTRLSSDMFEMALAAGASAAGAKVYLLGVCPTPKVFRFWFKRKALTVESWYPQVIIRSMITESSCSTVQV